jgi:hypothetical protein
MKTQKSACIDDGYENWSRQRKGRKKKRAKSNKGLPEIRMGYVIFLRRKDGKANLLRADHV